MDRKPEMVDMLSATARAEPAHFWFRGLRRFARTLLNGRLVRPARILDCGAGTGYNLTWLRDYGWAAGVELSSAGIALARPRKCPLVHASVAALPCPDATFDLVTSFDVLYCLDDDDERRAIAEMWRVVTPGGFVLVNVAALDMLHASHSVLTREVRRYTRPRLRAKLEAAGFEIARLSYTNCATLPITLAVRLAQRLTGAAGRQDDAELAVPSAPINAVLTALLAVEAFFLGWINLPIGSSVMCLARRPASGRAPR